ncbi:MAG: hypothetical protein RMH75_03560 [Archaeoglobaceae archaeon]|nr:hypothetical protein [Archaeoglobaceae archaeon]MDW7989731.1 hypothetical protein [Archaeoglobaceae archaeon]
MRLTILFSIILLALPVGAITISYEVSPEIVLPNGYADCIIKIVNNNISDVKINSISFFSNTVEVFPSYTTVGKIGPNSVYTLKVSMKSSYTGRHVVEMQISADNYSIYQPIELIVDDNFPQLTISSPLYRNEVKYATIMVSSPVMLRDLRIEALFNATPKILYVGTLSNFAQLNLKFSEDLENLRFRIYFYNGRSYHELERSLKPSYIPSRGISTNLQLSRDVVFVGEVLSISLEIVNLRSDEIYQIEVYNFGSGKFSRDYAKVEKLSSGEKRILNFIFSPRESGKVSILITYRDFFGQKHEKWENVSLLVLSREVLQITNLKSENVFGKTRISGEVVNYGHRNVLGAEVSAFCNDTKINNFIGEIEANDYETFELEVGCTEVILKLSWWNEVGESFSVSEMVKSEIVREEGSIIPLFVAVITSVAVFVFILYIFIRSRKK